MIRFLSPMPEFSAGHVGDVTLLGNVIPSKSESNSKSDKRDSLIGCDVVDNLAKRLNNIRTHHIYIYSSSHQQPIVTCYFQPEGDLYGIRLP